MKQKAIAYFRTSGETGSQNRGFGLATQKKDVADYCKTNGIEIVKTYISDGVSGAELEKDGKLIRMLEEMNGEDLLLNLNKAAEVLNWENEMAVLDRIYHPLITAGHAD